MQDSTITTLLLVAAIAVVAPVLADRLRFLRIPDVVIEIGLGILVGPQVLGWARLDDVVDGLSQLGLAFLMFLAGYEIEMRRIRGRPLDLALGGWAISLVLGFAFAFGLVRSGLALSTMLIGLAMTTTALGTLLPIVRDAGLLESRFGSYLMAVGSVGEFGPIVAIAVLLSGSNPLGTTVLLAVFLLVAVGAATVMLRAQPPRWLALLRENLHSSAQLPVRVSVLLIVVLIWVASRLGLDVLLGAFAAGMIVRLTATGPDADTVRIKLEGIGFGFLVPIFFVVSGIKFDLDALLHDPGALLRMAMFFVAFLVVRGAPVFALYRRDLSAGQRWALALFSGVQLPLVVVITTIGRETGRMLPVNAAALVGAGMLSVLVYPSLGIAVFNRSGTARRA